MSEKETKRTETAEEAANRPDDSELSDEDLEKVAGGGPMLTSVMYPDSVKAKGKEMMDKGKARGDEVSTPGSPLGPLTDYRDGH